MEATVVIGYIGIAACLVFLGLSINRTLSLRKIYRVLEEGKTPRAPTAPQQMQQPPQQKRRLMPRIKIQKELDIPPPPPIATTPQPQQEPMVEDNMTTLRQQRKAAELKREYDEKLAQL